MLEKNYSQKIQPLFDLGRESLLNKRDNLDYQKFGFVEEDIDELIKLALDTSFEDLDYDKYKKEFGRFFYATLHAIRILGKMQAEQAIVPILERMQFEDGENDFFYEESADLFLNIGVASIEPIKNHLFTKDGDKLSLFEPLCKIAEKYPETKESIEEILVSYLQTTQDNYIHLAFGISSLIDCSGAKHIDLIREIFRTKDVDTMMRGDIEDIEIELGLRETRDTPSSDMFDMFSFGRDEIVDNTPNIVNEKTGRNEPCPCGSGKKYKKCCMDN